jgi:hypothetical protein
MKDDCATFLVWSETSFCSDWNVTQPDLDNFYFERKKQLEGSGRLTTNTVTLRKWKWRNFTQLTLDQKRYGIGKNKLVDDNTVNNFVVNIVIVIVYC